MERTKELQGIDVLEGSGVPDARGGVSVGLMPEAAPRALTANLRLADLIVCSAFQDPGFRLTAQSKGRKPTEIFPPTTTDGLEQIQMTASSAVGVVEGLVGIDGTLRILERTAGNLESNLNGLAGDAREILDLIVLGLEIEKLDEFGQTGQANADNSSDPEANIGGEQRELVRKCKTKKDPIKVARKQQGRMVAAANEDRHQGNESRHVDRLGKRF